jgi:tetratricopeptide (TPR) repeat protein
MQFCQSGLSLAISTGSTKQQSLALQQLSSIKKGNGDLLRAQADAFESQRLAKTAGNLYVEAYGLRSEAVCWQYLGSYDHCISCLTRAAHLLDLCGMAGGPEHSYIWNSQAEVHCCKSEYAEAHKIRINILQDFSTDQDPFIHAFALLNIAQVDVEIDGSNQEVLHHCNTARLLFQKLNYSMGMTLCDMVKAALEVRQSNSVAARSLLQKCLTSVWGRDTEAVTYCLEKLASVQQWSPVHQMSFRWTVTFLVNSLKSQQMLRLHKALQFLGDVFQTDGDNDTAICLFTVALDGFTHMDVHRSRAECMVRLGDISKLNGDELKAVELWQTARPLFERSLQRKQLAYLDGKLASLTCDSAQEVQQETLHDLSKMRGPTQHLEGVSDTQNLGIEEIEGTVLENQKPRVPMDI